MNNLPDFAEKIIGLGVRPGDVLMVTAKPDFDQACGLAWNDIADVLLNIVGESGTILTPLYKSAEWALCGRNPENSELGKALIDNHSASAGKHPTHPFVAIGRLAELILEDSEKLPPFGKESVAFRAMQGNARQLMLGCGLFESPFVYLAEEFIRPPYMERSLAVTIKLSSGKSVSKRMDMPGCGRYFSIVADMLNENTWKEVAVGNTSIAIIEGRAVFEAARNLLKDDPASLLCDEPDCELCAQARAILDAAAADDMDKQIIALAEEEEEARIQLERKMEAKVSFFEFDHDSIKPN